MTADRRYTRVTWKIMEQLLEVDSIGDALSGSLEIIYNTLNSEAGAIWLLDKATDRLAPLFHIGPADISGVTVENGLGIEGMVTKTGKSIMVTDAQNDPRFDGTVFDDGGVVANTIRCRPGGVPGGQGAVREGTERVYGRRRCVQTGRFRAERSQAKAAGGQGAARRRGRASTRRTSPSTRMACRSRARLKRRWKSCRRVDGSS